MCSLKASAVRALKYSLEDVAKEVQDAQISEVNDEVRWESLPEHTSPSCNFLFDTIIIHLINDDV